jgi:hypothetical protein
MNCYDEPMQTAKMPHFLKRGIVTLQRLFETIFDLRGKVKVENDQRNVFIERNPKQEYIMRKLESALDIINGMGMRDTRECRYNFELV